MSHDPRDSSWIAFRPGPDGAAGLLPGRSLAGRLRELSPRRPGSPGRVRGLSSRRVVTAYIAVIGLLLTIGIVSQLLLALQVDEITALGPLSGLLPVLLFLCIGYWLTRSELETDNVLGVAKWGGLAIALLTLVNSAVILVHRFMTPVLTPGLTMLVSNVAVGGIIGLVFGWMREFDRKARNRYRKSTVLNRTLRHDLRNDVNVMPGALEVLERELPDEHLDRVELVRDRVSNLQSIGENAKHLQAAVEKASGEQRPVDVAAVLRDQVEAVGTDYPDVNIEANLPSEALVRADCNLPVVFANLLENAIEHNESDTRVVVDISVGDRPDMVSVTISDNGPGIPESELAVLRNGHETSLEHTSGTGLWLFKWLVSGYGGSVTFTATDDGTTVRVDIPRAQASGSRSTGEPVVPESAVTPAPT